MRTITHHIVAGDTSPQLKLEVTDAPGSGGANHKYEITGFDTAINPSKLGDTGYAHEYNRLVVLFQNGPLKTAGCNGITQEVLLAIVIDRLQSFQSGPFACTANAEALEHCTNALEALQRRTKDRLARQVEGTNVA